MKNQFLAVLSFLLITAVPFCSVLAAGQDTITTADGLKYIIIEKGNGEPAVPGKQVSVHYAGRLTDGKEFDNSFKRGKPIKFILGKGQVIKGWDEGIALMHVGDKFQLIIPSQLGYGENGAGGTIPPNATLIFETQLMAVGDPKLSIADTLLLTIFEKGIDAATVQYHELFKTKKNDYDFDEDQLIALAYRFMSNGMYQNAIGLLKLNIETYPESANSLVVLGEAYYMNSEKDNAVQCLEKALKINPNDTNAAEALKKIKEK